MRECMHVDPPRSLSGLQYHWSKYSSELLCLPDLSPTPPTCFLAPLEDSDRASSWVALSWLSHAFAQHALAQPPLSRGRAQGSHTCMECEGQFKHVRAEEDNPEWELPFKPSSHKPGVVLQPKLLGLSEASLFFTSFWASSPSPPPLLCNWGHFFLGTPPHGAATNPVLFLAVQ